MKSWTKCPKTDEEALAALQDEDNAVAAVSLVGLYLCKRGRGLSVLAALEETLLDDLKARGVSIGTSGGTEAQKGKR